MDSFAGLFDGFRYMFTGESTSKADKFDNLGSMKIVNLRLLHKRLIHSIRMLKTRLLHKRDLGSVREIKRNNTPRQKRSGISTKRASYTKEIWDEY